MERVSTSSSFERRRTSGESEKAMGQRSRRRAGRSGSRGSAGEGTRRVARSVGEGGERRGTPPPQTRQHAPEGSGGRDEGLAAYLFSLPLSLAHEHTYTCENSVHLCLCVRERGRERRTRSPLPNSGKPWVNPARPLTEPCTQHSKWLCHAIVRPQWYLELTKHRPIRHKHKGRERGGRGPGSRLCPPPSPLLPCPKLKFLNK